MILVILPFLESLNGFLRVLIQNLRKVDDAAIRSAAAAAFSGDRNHDIGIQTANFTGINGLIDFLESFDFRMDDVGSCRNRLKTEVSTRIGVGHRDRSPAAREQSHLAVVATEVATLRHQSA